MTLADGNLAIHPVTGWQVRTVGMGALMVAFSYVLDERMIEAAHYFPLAITLTQCEELIGVLQRASQLMQELPPGTLIQ